MKFELIDEGSLSLAQRRGCHTLLVEAFGQDAVTEEAWTQRRPVARVLALHDGDVVGQGAWMGLETDAILKINGLSDLAVRHSHRCSGIGKQLIEWQVSAAAASGQILLTATSVPTVVHTFNELGFVSVDPWSFYYQKKGCCTFNPDWLQRGGPGPARRHHRIVSDF